jgi:signal peptidase I
MRQLAVPLLFITLLGAACSGEFDLSTNIRENWVQAFYISSTSSAPGLLRGDRILVDKRAYRDAPPSRGDLVVFWVSAPNKDIFPRDRYPNAERKAFIFRVVGLPGDRIRIKNGDVYINDQPELVSPVNGPSDIEGQSVQIYRVASPHRSYTIARLANPDFRSFPDMLVEPNRYFVMGDNRDRAYDSRYWGTVHRDDIFGKAWIIYFSTKPGTLWVRPSRFFLPLHEGAD